MEKLSSLLYVQRIKADVPVELHEYILSEEETNHPSPLLSY